MNYKQIAFTFLFIIIGLTLLFGGYSRWNSANPQKTCASCHEISPSVGEWQQSGHRNIRCTECHGTAISNGFHSLKEKSAMLFTHLGKNPEHENIRMTEKQVLELSSRCANCHQSEFAKWNAGGHSVNYASIFMNGKHNLQEAPYWACLRCHGMFYDGNIKTLLQEPEQKGGVWKLKDMNKATEPTIPCLSCHSIHSNNEVLQRVSRYDEPQKISYERQVRNPVNSWYVRESRQRIRTDKLMKLTMFDQGRAVKVSDDPAVRLCMQCHSPKFNHQAGSEDDRTPTGVHEGISCMACHAAHSNDSRNSCRNCHPAISNCKLDVTKMNTSYSSIKSTNNIHSVSCRSCHSEEEMKKIGR